MLEDASFHSGDKRDRHTKYNMMGKYQDLFKTAYVEQEMICLCSKSYTVSKTIISRETRTIIAATNFLRNALKLPPF